MFSTLSNEICSLIFQNLPFSDLLTCRFVCKLWNEIILNSPELSQKLTYYLDLSEISVIDAKTAEIVHKLQHASEDNDRVNGRNAKLSAAKRPVTDLDSLIEVLSRHDKITHFRLVHLTLLCNETQRGDSSEVAVTPWMIITEKLCQVMSRATHLELLYCYFFREVFQAFLHYCPIESVHGEYVNCFGRFVDIPPCEPSSPSLDKIFKGLVLKSPVATVTEFYFHDSTLWGLEHLSDTLRNVRRLYLEPNYPYYFRIAQDAFNFIVDLPSLTQLTLGSVAGIDLEDSLLPSVCHRLSEITLLAPQCGLPKFTELIKMVRRALPSNDTLEVPESGTRYTFHCKAWHPNLLRVSVLRTATISPVLNITSGQLLLSDNSKTPHLFNQWHFVETQFE